MCSSFGLCSAPGEWPNENEVSKLCTTHILYLHFLLLFYQGLQTTSYLIPQPMDLHLTDKTAFISGSTMGIGYATAEALVREGVTVILNGRSEAGVKKAVNRLKLAAPNGKISGISADFGKIEEINHLLDQLPRLDILVNNVGIFSAQSFFQTPDEDWQRQFEVNVMSGVRLCRKILPQMLAQNAGRIIFISSECATLVPEDLLAYSTSKTTLLALSRGLAQLTKGTAVTVNSVIPGSTLTEGAENFLAELAEREHKTTQQVEADFFTQSRPQSILQRFATVDEVANTILYLVSPLASAINGSAVKVDGGSMGGIM